LLDRASILRKALQSIIQKEPYFQDYEIISVHQSERLIEYLAHEGVHILVIVDYEIEKWIPLLEIARQIAPQTIRIAFAQKWHQASLSSVINSAQIFRALDLTCDDHELKSHFISADREAESFQARSRLKSIYAEQNQKLELLNADLEKMVEEKTADIRSSKELIDEKVQRVRQLTAFIKELSSQVTFFEFLNLLRRDIRKFAKTGDPVLIIKKEMLYFQSGSIARHKIKGDLSISKKMNLNDKDIAGFLADVFQRPVVQTITLPLSDAEALLCIEHSMSSSELKVFQEHLIERTQPMSMALDRAFLQKEISHQYYLWEKTFDGLKDPIAIIDSEYSVIRSNKKFSDRIIHRACYQEFSGRSSLCPECPVSEAVQSGQPHTQQIQVKGKVYEVTSYPIVQAAHGKSTSVVNQYKDITGSRELYARLLQNEKMSAIGLLAGNIAHELNNPLTGIRSLSQVLITQTSDRIQLHNDLKEIEKAAARSQQIIRNLLEFSSGTTNTTKLISIDEIFQRTLPVLKTITRNLKTRIQLNCPNELVLVEPQLIQQVIFNLIQNASQAMEGQAHSGELTIQSRLNQDGSIELSVKDNGPGIPKKIQQKIFEPFFTTKSEEKGTGLGLSLSQEILHRFGGDLTLISKEGEGSEFIIRLPRAPQAK